MIKTKQSIINKLKEYRARKLNELDDTNLAKFYKNVFHCKLCKIKYGSDLRKDDGHCPICRTEVWQLAKKQKEKKK